MPSFGHFVVFGLIIGSGLWIILMIIYGTVAKRQSNRAENGKLLVLARTFLSKFREGVMRIRKVFGARRYPSILAVGGDLLGFSAILMLFSLGSFFSSEIFEWVQRLLLLFLE